jgi:adenosylmethionine-8-amino-7-oxononanoate aminotransferase
VGHTHKAHPLACAVGLAVLQETAERGLVQRANETGDYLRSRLSALQNSIAIVGNVRGLGLLNAVEIVANQTTKAMLPRDLDVLGRLQAIARAKGLLIYGRRTHAGKFGDWLMVTPPLIASHDDIDEIVDGLSATFKVYCDELRKAGCAS